ncbi:MAG: hypothetical protein ACLFNW_13625 [Desulfobacterales bacterium]
MTGTRHESEQDLKTHGGHGDHHAHMVEDFKKRFWELATLIDIMLPGHWIEMRSVMGASRALEELAKHMPADEIGLDDYFAEVLPVRRKAGGNPGSVMGAFFHNDSSGI